MAPSHVFVYPNVTSFHMGGCGEEIKRQNNIAGDLFAISSSCREEKKKICQSNVSSAVFKLPQREQTEKPENGDKDSGGRLSQRCAFCGENHHKMDIHSSTLTYSEK